MYQVAAGLADGLDDRLIVQGLRFAVDLQEHGPLAGGGIAFGAWKGGWSGGKDREEPHLKTYSQFIRDNTQYLFPRQSAAEVTLIYPRSSVFSGDIPHPLFT